MREHKPIKRKPNPIKTALKYQRLKDSGLSLSDIGRQYGVSRVRIHQYLNLLNLDEKVIAMLANTKDATVVNYWAERRLRKLLTMERREQGKSFRTFQ